MHLAAKTDDIAVLLDYLPDRVRRVIPQDVLDVMEEIVMDLERAVRVRVPGDFLLLPHTVTAADLEQFVRRVGMFRTDARAGIPGTLHRVSAVTDRFGDLVGVAVRVGRHIPGVAEPLRFLLEGRRSLLILGPPGTGKTTILRDAARILADDLKKNVVIVDTSNEIGGEGAVPHPAIGTLSRRLQVRVREEQYRVMLQAVQNQTAEVIIIDEIGTREEAEAAATIAKRGVQLIGTAHGETLQDLLDNEPLHPLLGGIERVVQAESTEALRRALGSGAAGRRVARERVGAPAFAVGVELRRGGEREMVVYDLKSAVDALLNGETRPGTIILSARVDLEARKRARKWDFLIASARATGRIDPWAEQIAEMMSEEEER